LAGCEPNRHPHRVENGPQGTRTIVQIVGGRFEGPHVKASIQTPAGDWITNRADGSYRLDVRLTLKRTMGANPGDVQWHRPYDRTGRVAA